MTVIKNKGFRVFLYILGYFSAAAVIALSVITAMRYTYYADDMETAACYAETEAVRYTVNHALSGIQTEAKAVSAWTESELSDSSLVLFDFATGKKEKVKLTGLAEKGGYSDVLAGLIQASYSFERAESENGYPPDEDYFKDTYVYDTGSSADRSDCFLQIRTNDLLKLIHERGAVFSNETLGRYFELQNMVASEPGTAVSEDAEKEFSLYSELVNSGYPDYLSEGDRFILLDPGIFILPADHTHILRTGTGHGAAPYSFFLDTSGSETLYISLTEELASLKTLDAGADDRTLGAVLSGRFFSSPFEAFYSSLDEEQQGMILGCRQSSYGNYIFANTAYSFGNDEVSGSNITDYRGISDSGIPADITKSYKKLASGISSNADIYIRYDSEKSSLEQWYRDPSGNRHDYVYVSNLKDLTGSLDEDFVFGMNLYKSYSDSTGLAAFAFPVCKAVPSPALLLIISAVVFLACVILLLIGVKPKLLVIDKVPFEIFLVCSLILLFLVGWVIPREYFRSIFTLIQKDLPASIAAGLLMILALYVITAALFTTIARRIKCRYFIKSLLVVKLAKLVITGIRRLAGKIARGCGTLSRHYENSVKGNKRLTIFASVLFAVNALILLLFGMLHPSAFLFNLLVIAAEAFAGYHLLKYSAGVEKVLAVSRQIEAGDLQAQTDPSELEYNVKELGESLNHLGTGLQKAVESSIRDERTKAELITNVSHDIKTPLTSIISYVDLLKKEEIGNERAREYINVLDQKSQRLKQLIMDLIEVSKTNTGNIELERTNLNLTELLDQAFGEYEEKMAAAALEPVKNIQAEDAVIYADGRRVFRIIDNIFNNAVKYAQPGTRVYIDLNRNNDSIIFSVKNVSREMLNISAEELTERFVRGDRARHTEGSGLGLSIAKNLTELQDGTFRIQIDGDLFKVEITFPAVNR